MNYKELHNIYFLGIGGIGMSALARFFNVSGKNVSGYDKVSTVLTKQMEKEGIDIYHNADYTHIPDHVDLVVYTPAIPQDNIELKWCKEHGIPLQKRAELLGKISNSHKTIAISGTHGKTTTSSIIAHILHSSGCEMIGFIGGISSNYNSNLIMSKTGNSSYIYMVVEADEYDRSFLSLHPAYSIITAVDADHLDVYGNKQVMRQAFLDFASQTGSGNMLVKYGIDIEIKAETYGLDEKADHRAENIVITGGKFRFDYVGGQNRISNLTLGMQGKHNVENAIAACATAFHFGISATDISKALASYKGVTRRFQYIINRSDLIFIDDYAHHPVEITSCLKAIKELYPEKKLTGIFQPHLYSRTRDFANEFALSLSILDRLILLPIYPAREEPIKGVNSELIFDMVQTSDKVLCNKEDLINILSNEKPEVLVTLGAGDIDTIIPILKSHLLAI